MKTFINLTWVTLLMLLLNQASAQTSDGKTDSTLFKRVQNVYVELGGPGLLFSANYDTRFQNRQDGIGGRVGLGLFATGGFSLTTVPVQLNYLLGKKGKYFEIGLGGTFVKANNNNDNDNDDFFDFNESTTIGTMTFAYRYQPVNGGFNFRGGLNTLFNSSNFVPFYGVSFGYTF
ncbi:hypothetical protein ACFQ3S_06475 [Mucilaginibacter terrae]|uniref:hypothetical protein n=1 Tax=Mucilaginibacter terrae TaxID=1955052 RepID=UPI0036266331